MPIYEFYCPSCNLLIEFFSRRVNTNVPACPHCGGTLSKEVSRISLGPGENSSSDELGDVSFDESRMENAVRDFQDKFEAMGDDSDPRRSAELIRQFSDASGLSFNKDIREAMDRIASGEDPEKVSSEMDEIIDSGEDPFAPADRGGRRAKAAAAPAKDPVLYEM